jgi:ABC-type phosphate/phosphonate transport system substrate-binding protein
MDKIQVIWRTDNIIPNDNVSFSTAMAPEMRTKISDALVQMGSSDDGLEILKNMGYEIGGFKPAEDSFYDAFRTALQASGIDITTMVK